MGGVSVIKLDRFEIRKPFFDPNPDKTTTGNHAWRVGLFLVFKTPANDEFWYMPRWDEIAELLEKKEEIEKKNKELCVSNNSTRNKG